MKNKKKKKSKLSPESLQKKMNIFNAKNKSKKSKAFAKKVKKREKKNRKKHQKIMELVKPEFGNFGEEMVGFLAKSVAVHKKLKKRDDDAIAKWRGEYYDTLFNKIKKLIIEHNERMQFDADKLGEEIAKKRQKLDELRGNYIVLGEEVQKLKTEKGILENA